jgi:hypothetical protein
MATHAVRPAHNIRSEKSPDLGRKEVRENLSPAAIEGFFAILDKWGVSVDRAGELLGGIPRSSVYKLKTAPTALRQDELLRISYVVGIYKALHTLLRGKQADEWVTRPNDHPLFRGLTPLEFMLRGIPAMQQVRKLVDAEAYGGQFG